MKFLILNILAVVSLLAMAPASAEEEAIQLLKKNNCLGCHKVEGKKVGPSYMDVAQRYKTVANAEVLLAEKIAHGGNGAWGTMPMPANYPRVQLHDIKIMVTYILSLAK